VFPSVTEAWWHIWASWVGAVGRSGAAGLEVRLALVVRPTLHSGPGVSLLWCVCLIQHDRDEFGLLGASAWNYNWWETE
jgi:hypothetical protein